MKESIERANQWAEEGKQVFIIMDELKPAPPFASPFHTYKPTECYSLSYGDDEEDAIKGTILENPKGVEIVKRVIKPFDGVAPDCFCVGAVKL